MFIAAKTIRDSIAAHQLYILDHKHALTDFQKKEEKKKREIMEISVLSGVVRCSEVWRGEV